MRDLDRRVRQELIPRQGKGLVSFLGFLGHTGSGDSIMTVRVKRTSESESTGFSGANVSLSSGGTDGVDLRFSVERRPRLAAIRAQEGSP